MDWDAATYDTVSDPQLAWGRRIIARLAPRAGERILDLGCGTGRLTVELLETMGLGHVVAVDRSSAMLREAAARNATYALHIPLHDASVHPCRLTFVQADGASLPFADAFDAVFSTATLHWIKNHDAVFASIYRALAPGGRLVAQCGGGPNLKVLLGRAHALMRSQRYSDHFSRWEDPWEFADVPTTMARLERAGFSAVDVSLEPAPTTLADKVAYTDFLSCICVRRHVERLPEPEQRVFLEALAEKAAGDDPPFTLDYWRLNISATKPAGAEQAA